MGSLDHARRLAGQEEAEEEAMEADEAKTVTVMVTETVTVMVTVSFLCFSLRGYMMI